MTILHSLTNPRDLSDEDLDQLRIDVLIEQERRASLATIPGEIANLADRYRAGGGATGDLEAAVSEDQPA